MKVLGNDGEIILVENLFATDNRIERAETGVIERHDILGNAQVQERALHVQRFIIVL
ncbi:hypothetical protein D3C87_2054450 [compost metagenome]